MSVIPYRHILRLLLLAIVLCGLNCGSCGGPGDPERPLRAYYAALMNGDSDDAYGLLSRKDRDYKNLETYRQWLMRRGWPLADISDVRKKSDLIVRNMQQDENKATAVIEYYHPPFRSLYDELQTGQGMVDPKKFHQEIKAVIKRNGYNPKIITRQVTLLNERGRWRLYMNFEEDERYREKLASARLLEQSHHWQQAIETYEEIVLWDRYFEDAAERLEELKSLMAGQQANAEYIEKYMRLDDIEIEEMALDARHVLGRVENLGKRTVLECGVVFQYLDKEGAVLGETVRFPVMVSRVPGPYSEPLEGGDRVRFNFDLEDRAPKEWKDRISAKISVIKLEDRP